MPALSHDSTPFFRRGPSPFARFVFFGLFSLAILFADARYGYLEGIRGGVALFLSPLQRAALLPVQAWDVVAAYFASQTKLSDENSHLKRELLAQGVQAQSAQSLAQENVRLRGLLKAHTRSAGNAILAEVVYLGRDPFSQKVFVNKGSNDQVRPGQAVVDDAGVVGQVTRAFPAVSEVTLLTEKDHTIPVKIERNGIRTLLVGRRDRPRAGTSLHVRQRRRAVGRCAGHLGPGRHLSAGSRGRGGRRGRARFRTDVRADYLPAAGGSRSQRSGPDRSGPDGRRAAAA
jgi:rod shape-determining protein MreC